MPDSVRKGGVLFCRNWRREEIENSPLFCLSSRLGMMKMAENPKLNSGLSTPNLSLASEDCGMEETESQKIVGCADPVDGFPYKSESFVVDMEGCYSDVINKDPSPTTNSRITLQRSLSRKGSHRGGEKKPNSVAPVDADAVLASSSPRVGGGGRGTLEKPSVVGAAADDHQSPQLHHHHIAISENRSLISRRYSFRRGSPSWLIDPRRVLFLFATLSSMGTILLIYFTLSLKRLGAVDDGGDSELNWQQ